MDKFDKIDKLHIKMIGGFMIPTIYCFPKKFFPNKEDAIKIAEELCLGQMEKIDKVTEHQVGLFHIWKKTSYEYDEWDEYWDYRYCDEYNPTKKYSERFAPSCWCIETTFNEQWDKFWEEQFVKIGEEDNDNS